MKNSVTVVGVTFMYLLLFGQLNISLRVAPIQLMHQDESITFILKQGAIEFLIYSS